MKYLAILWVCLATSLNASSQPGSDTTAIKALLEKEAATWRAGDEKGHAACWQVRPYSRILVSTADGRHFDVDPALVIKPAPGMMGGGGKAELSNFKFSIQGAAAWVSHDELSTSAEGKQSWSWELRLLEKINGEWKLVGQSIHIYKQQ